MLDIIGTWKRGLIVAGRIWLLGAFLLLAYVALIAIEEIYAYELDSPGTSVVWVFVSYYLHDTYLRGRFVSKPPKEQNRLWPFTWRTLILLAIIIVISLLISFNTGVTAVESVGAGVLFFLLLSGLVSWVVTALVGTWPMAALAGGNRSIGAAFRRGWSTWPRVAVLLVLGPGIFSLASLVLSVGPMIILGHLGAPNLVGMLVASCLANAFTFLAMALTAVIVCDAYKRAEDPILPQAVTQAI